MKSTTFFLVLLLYLMLNNKVSQSQVLVTDSVVSFLSGIEDEIQKSGTDKNGNIYIAGTFKSPTLTIGNQVLTNDGGNDVFLIKFDPEMKVLFAKSFVSVGYSTITGLGIGTDGSIYLSGIYKNSMKFDDIKVYNISGEDETSGIYLGNSFVVKTDRNGKAIWAKSYGGMSRISTMAIDKSNDVYVFGGHLNELYFSDLQIYHSPLGSNNFLVKISSAGYEKWCSQLFGRGSVDVIMIGKNQDIFLTGNYSDSIRFDNHTVKTISSVENHTVYLAKANLNGKFKWVRKITDGGHALVGGALLDTVSNSIFLSGTYKSSTLTFGSKKLQNNGDADIFIAKVDTAAKVLLAKSFGATNSEWSFGLTRISPANFGMVGTSFSESIPFESVSVQGGGTGWMGNFFTVVFDNDCVPLWGKSYPKSAGQAIKSIISDGKQNVYVTGDFYGAASTKSASVAGEPTYVEKPSLYLMRFKQGVTPVNQINNQYGRINIYPNPCLSNINIKTDYQSTNCGFEIYNTEGKIMLKQSSENAYYPINVESFPAGVYLIKIQSGENSSIAKFIKK